MTRLIAKKDVKHICRVEKTIQKLKKKTGLKETNEQFISHVYSSLIQTYTSTTVRMINYNCPYRL